MVSLTCFQGSRYGWRILKSITQKTQIDVDESGSSPKIVRLTFLKILLPRPPRLTAVRGGLGRKG